jgi:hypothetical protein
VNEAQAARLRPKGLPRPLAKRSVIDPFIVMDVMAEANARAKTGEDISRRPPSRRSRRSGAFDGLEELEEIKAVYARNRAMLFEELPRAGLSAILPADEAFYLYADVSRFTANSEAFAKAMLKDIGVAVTPGIDFDPERGQSYLRFSYAGPEPRMREAARRIGDWLKTR